MGWEDRLKPAAYTGPDGVRIEFEYVDVRKTIDKKTHEHEFPQADVSYVQDNGIKGRKYPCRCLFSGADNDILADRFENLLVQRGPGSLEHPRYGQKLVSPIGSIERLDALVNDTDQVVFELTFKETIASVYPADSEATRASIDVAVASEDFVEQLVTSLDVEGPGERAGFLATMKALAAGIRRGIKRAENGTSKLQVALDRVDRSINNAISTGVGTPLTLAAQLKQMALMPARSGSLLADRLAAYKNLAGDIFSGNGTGAGGGTGSSESGIGVVQAGVIQPGINSTEANTFHANNYAAQLSILGLALAASAPGDASPFRSRDDVIAAIEELEDTFDAWQEWSDLNFAALANSTPTVDPFAAISTGQGSTDTGAAQAALRIVVAAAIRYLFAAAFLLPVQRVFVVSRARTILDLCAQLYGTIDDDVFEGFIQANRFTSDEIVELQPGRRVAYYI